MRAIRPSDDPDERRRVLAAATQAYQEALERHTADREAGRMPSVGVGALAVLAKRLEDATAHVAELAELEEAGSSSP